MPVTTYTLTGDFGALIGEVQAIRAIVTTNSTDGAWVNETDDEIRLGGAALTLNEAGEFSVSLPTSTGTGLQYQVSADYVDADKKRRKWDSGWFDLTANADLADRAADSSLRVNSSQAVILGGRIDDAEDRLEELEAGGGTQALAARVDGYTDHGNVYGGVTLSGPTASHWFSATAPTTITLEGYSEGQVVTLICFSGAEDVTVNDAGDTELVDGTAWSAMLARGVWIGGGGGGELAVPDATPPSAPTALTVTPGSDGVSATATFTPGVDAESTVKHRYILYPTSGSQPAWPTSGPAYNVTSPVALTDLTSGTAYTMKVQAYSNGGSQSTVATATFTTPTPAGWNTIVTDTFTGPDGPITARTPDSTSGTGGWRPGPAENSPAAGALTNLSLSSGRLTFTTGDSGVLKHALNIGSGTRSGLRIGVDYQLATQSDSLAPIFWVNSGRLKTALLHSGVIAAANSGADGDVTLTGATTGHPTSGRYEIELHGTALSVLINGVEVATGTTADNHNADTFVGIDMTSFGSSYLDNFTVEALT